MNLDDATLEALHQTFHRLESRWVPPVPPVDHWFAYDPLPLALFLPGIASATAHQTGRRFLDVGCGIGTKLALMHALGWEVAGVDRHEPYLAAAAEMVPEADLRLADLFDLDGFDADLVYMYRPAVSDRLAEEAERHVIAGMSPGSLLFLPTRTPPVDLEPIGQQLWVV